MLGLDGEPEEAKGETVWEGEVLVFSLLDHPEASLAYAWEVEGRITCVLGVGPVDSPIKPRSLLLLRKARASRRTAGT